MSKPTADPLVAAARVVRQRLTDLGEWAKTHDLYRVATDHGHALFVLCDLVEQLAARVQALERSAPPRG